MDGFPAECAPYEEYHYRPMDPMEAVRISDRRVCKLRRELELQFLSDAELDAKSGLCGATLQLQASIYR